MKAAGNHVIRILSTITMDVRVRDDSPGSNTGFSVLRVTVSVVNVLSKNFILSARDLAGYDTVAFQWRKGYLVFRHNGRLWNRRAATLDRPNTHEIRVPCVDAAQRVMTASATRNACSLSPSPDRVASAVSTAEELVIKAHSNAVYRIKIPNAVYVVPPLPKRDGADTAHGSYDHPSMMEVESSLPASPAGQYMVTTFNPLDSGHQENSIFTEAQIAVPFTHETLVDIREDHRLLLENRTDADMVISCGTVIAYIQSIEHYYGPDEYGCVAMDIGALLADVSQDLLMLNPGRETEVMIDGSDYDVPLPIGGDGVLLELYPWLTNAPLAEVKQWPNYRKPSDDDLEEMKGSELWKTLRTTEVWEKADEVSRAAIEKMLLDYSFLFSNRAAAGSVDPQLVQHDVELVDDQIIRARQYPITKESRDAIQVWILEMLANGFIRPSNSPYRSPLLVVAKLTSDGKWKGWRTVFDARRINAVTKEYPGVPPPSTEQIWNDIRGGLLFSTTDFKAGFYNVSMTDRASRITAFANPTDGRLYEHVRMPMGLIGAPATFAKLGSLVFHELISVCMQIYVDDLCVYTTDLHVDQGMSAVLRRNNNSPKGDDPSDGNASGCPPISVDGTLSTFSKRLDRSGRTPPKEPQPRQAESEEKMSRETASEVLTVHTLQLEAVFQKCTKAGLLCALKKTHIAQPHVSLLGHEIGVEGLKPCPKKTEAIRLAPSPIDVSGVRRALGCFGFYRRFIPRFTERTINIRKMLKKGVEFGWTPDMETEYVAIKEILSSAPVVQPPDYSREFFVNSDGSKVGLAGFVWQKGDDGDDDIRVIGYWSRSCTAAEGNYDARELETLAVLGTLTKYRAVLPRKFTLYTDHLNLLKLKTYVSHKTRLSSWSNRLSVFAPEIKHIAGVKNVVADWLSRTPVRPSVAPMITVIRRLPIDYSILDDAEPFVESMGNVRVRESKQKVHCQNQNRNGRKSMEETNLLQSMHSCGMCNVEVEGLRDTEIWMSLEACDNAQRIDDASKQSVLSMNLEINVTEVDPSIKRRMVVAPARVTTKDLETSQKLDKRGSWYRKYYLQEDQIRQSDMHCRRNLLRSTLSTPKERKAEKILLLKYFEQTFGNLEKFRSKASIFYLHVNDETGVKLLVLKGRPSTGAFSKSSQEGIDDGIGRMGIGPIYVGQSIRDTLLWWYHDSLVGNHTGIDDLSIKLKLRFYWPTMVKDAKRHVQSCLRCKCAKQRSRDSWRNIGRAPVPGGVYDTVFLDLVHVSSADGGCTSHRGNTHVLSIVCRLSGHCSLIPVRISFSDLQKERISQRKMAAKKATGKRKEKLQLQDTGILSERAAVIVAVNFYERVCLILHKKPRVLICDNGTEFANALLKRLSKLMKIRMVCLTPENPRANYVERLHSVLGQRLKIMTNDALFPDKKNWDQFVPYIQHSLNQRSIVDRLTPAHCVFGRDDNLLVDDVEGKVKELDSLQEPMPKDRESLQIYAAEMLKRQNLAASLFATKILLDQEQRLSRRTRQRYHEFFPGDFVLLKRRNIGSKKKGSSSKLNLRWSGPHTVIRRIHAADVYEIKLYNSSTTLKAPTELLAPLDSAVLERPAENTIWTSAVPKSGAELFPQQGDKLILIGLPGHLCETSAKVKGKLEFYVVEYQRMVPANTDQGRPALWRVMLMGNSSRRSKTIVASNVNPTLSSHYPAWIAGETCSNLDESIRYGNVDLTEKGYRRIIFDVSDEFVLPISPFNLSTSAKLPTAVMERATLLLSQREMRKN